MQISIVIPCFNEAKSLGQLLPLPYEVIVAPADSDDATVETAAQFGATIAHSSRGRGPQMNAGAERAGGDMLVFLHADTRLPDGFAKALQDAADAGKQAGCCLTRHDGSGLFYRLIDWGANLRARRLRTFYGDHVIWCRREVFERIGGFPPLPLLEDVAFSRLLKKHRVATEVLPLAARVSSRRFEANGKLRTLGLMLWIRVQFALGVSAEKLARWYS